MRTFGIVDRQVFPQQGPLIGFELAARIGAGIRVVGLRMLVQSALFGKGSVTDITFERFVSRVDGLVKSQIELVLAALFTKRADIRLLRLAPFLMRRSLVPVQMSLQSEGFRTIVPIASKHGLSCIR